MNHQSHDGNAFKYAHQNQHIEAYVSPSLSTPLPRKLSTLSDRRQHHQQQACRHSTVTSASRHQTLSQNNVEIDRMSLESHQRFHGLTMMQLRSMSHRDSWNWNPYDSSSDCRLLDENTVLFHPVFSESTAAIRADRPLERDGGFYYWEVTLLEKIEGTSIMVGLCTMHQSLSKRHYCNLIGLDNQGWSLSHRGHLWHNGIHRPYTQYYNGNRTVTLGLLYDSLVGTLTYYENDKCLGIAFTGLHRVQEDLYPVVGSTALNTRVRLDGAYKGFQSLQERCRSVVHKHFPNRRDLLQHQLGKPLMDYMDLLYMPDPRRNVII